EIPGRRRRGSRLRGHSCDPLSRPRIAEDAEQGRLRLQLALGDGPIDPLADETLVPGRRLARAVEIAIEVDQQPIALIAGEGDKIAARERVEPDHPGSRRDLRPRGGGDEDCRACARECRSHALRLVLACCYFAGLSSEMASAWVYVMSTRSPTLTAARFFGFLALMVSVCPSGPLMVTVCAFLSMAVTVAVIEISRPLAP